MPPSMRDWLPEGHLAYFISDTIDEMDLSEIEGVYEKSLAGYPPYHLPVSAESNGCFGAKRTLVSVESNALSERSDAGFLYVILVA